PWDRAARVFGLAVAVYLAGLFVTPASLPLAVAGKALLLAAFPVALWAVGFFEESELERARQLGIGLRKRLVPAPARPPHHHQSTWVRQSALTSLADCREKENRDEHDNG